MSARTDDLLVEFGCEFGDVVCLATEKQGNWIADGINWLAELTLSGQDFRPGDTNWNTSIDQMGMWLGMAILVMVITAIVGITWGAIMQRPDLIKRSLLATLASVPAFYFSMFIVGEGLSVIDEISDGLLAKLTDSGGFSQIIETMFDADAKSEPFEYIATPPIGRMMLVLVAMAISLFIIMLALAFRNFVLMILITFAPLAFVLLPATGSGDVWAKRWMSALTAMALAKPLIFGVLTLILASLGNVETIWSGEGLTLVIGMGISGFMPMLAYGFFQFIGGGGGGDDIGQRAGSSTSQKTQRLVSAIGRKLPNGGGGGGGGGRISPRGGGAGSGNGGGGGGGGGGGKPSSTNSKNETNKSDTGSKKDRSRPGQGPAANGRFGDGEGTPPSSREDAPTQTPKARPSQGAGDKSGDEGARSKERSRPPVNPTLTKRPAPQVPREPRR